MHPKSTPQGLQDDLMSIVCARCGEKKPAGGFVSKRKSAGNTKNCLECRSRCNSHRSRSKGATLTLRNLAVGPSSTESPAPKRTEEDARLSPLNDRFGTQPTSPERLRQCHTAKTLSGASISQPRVVLGTPICHGPCRDRMRVATRHGSTYSAHSLRVSGTHFLTPGK
ncbi:hypothetical protein EDB80DRAFT_735247 [Ilyonectria destructans]|nr:hypothetical protein EDB80DRAFT_735247 [Ilyonectria destructans]